MKIVICEDEEYYSEMLSSFVKEWARRNGVLTRLYVYCSAEQFLFSTDETADIDIIFIDIKMKEISGFELARDLRKNGYVGDIVFVTDSAEYVYEGYNVSALNYFLKPPTYEKCAEVLDRVVSRSTDKKCLLCKTSDGVLKLAHSDILHIDMDSHYAVIYTKDGRHITRRTMSELLCELGSKLFVKCSRSAIVNVAHVTAVSKRAVILSDGSSVEVKSKYLSGVNDGFIKYNLNRW